MTSASELFQNWRSRTRPSIGRTLFLDHPPGSEDGHPELRQHRRRRPPVSDGRRLLRRVQARHARRLASMEENDSDRTDHVEANESRTITSNSYGTSGSRFDNLRLNTSDNLPTNVLQARERLLQRLGSTSVTRTRRITTRASVIPQDGFASGDSLDGIDLEEWPFPDPAIDWSELEVTLAGMVEGANQASVLQGIRKKPPGLSWKIINGLQQEMFAEKQQKDVLETSLDCSICLERFCEGDMLIRLHCGHRFHRGCLEPWVRACGDCPYCRSSI